MTTRCSCWKARCSTTPRAKSPTASISCPLGVADLKREGEPLLDHHLRQDGARRAPGAPTSWRRRAFECDVLDLRTVRPMDEDGDHGNPSARPIARSCSKRDGRCAGIGAQIVGLHPARVLRRPRCARPPRPPGRCANAVRQESRAGRQARRRQDHRGSEARHVPRRRNGGIRMATKVSWKRSRPQWRRGASSRGTRPKAIR